MLSGFESQLEAQEQIDIVNAQIEEWQKSLDKLAGLKNELYSTDDVNKNDISEQLQNEIEYYKNILNAVEIMRDRYSDEIDKEIDAIEEVKDSLSEANDERQRELDLIEARNNLENAKKRKVWVYSEDGGFQQVRDEGAIKEAEEKYRDVITDIQEAELDKQIKELENKKKQLEESVKDLTEFNQRLEEGVTLEQAKDALGLVSDKDLLNLSEAIRDGIKNGLADAYVAQVNEENKEKTDRNGKPLYTPVSMDDVLKSVGASVTADDIKAISSSMPKLAEYAAAQMAADNLNQYKDMASSTVINNTGNTVSSIVNVYDVNDPHKVAEVVRNEIAEVFTKIENSIK